ncbi:MAG: DNA polymerase III subunit beta [Thermodesulfobacteriota bacterium]|nr:DNA polymerase III subunit beta [Thermodesulfobacteriota bacterium]
MKVAIQKKDIIDMLANVQGIAGKKSGLAITENLLITTLEESVSVCATDIEIGFQGTYPAVVKISGKIAINARDLYGIVKKISNPDIYISEEKKQWIQISDTEDGTRLKYNIVGGNVEDFPQLPQINEIAYIKINSPDFREMISWATTIAPQGNEKRAHILGASLVCRPGLPTDPEPGESDVDAEENNQELPVNKDKITLRMISTDGRRLTKTDYVYNNETGLEDKTSILIPKKALNEVFKFLKEEGEVAVGFRDNYFVVKKENEIIYINLLHGDFPDLTSLFTEDEDRRIITVDRRQIREMIERMAILTSDDYKGVIFRFEDNYLYINAANPDKGESYEYLEIDFKDEKVEMMFNPHYFIDAFNLIEEDNVWFKLKGENSPCIVCGENNENNINIIMPMKI